MDDFTIKRNDAGSFYVQLSICLQMELGEYVEPIPGVSDTYESEERVYLVTVEELQHWCVKARRYAAKYAATAQDCISMQRMKATYQDVTRIITHGEVDGTGYSNEPYEADEDLMFLYNRMAALHHFIFEARFELLKLSREEAKLG